MNPPPVLIKTQRRSRKKRKTQDLSTKPSVLQDDEQIATQNLFNVSNLQDSINQQKKFNTTFDMFRSVKFNEEDSFDENPDPKLIKTSRVANQQIYYPQSLDLKSKKRFSHDKADRSSTKKYETVQESFPTKSQLLKIRKEKLRKLTLQKGKNPSVFNELKSNTVFVGKIANDISKKNGPHQNSFDLLFKVLGNPNNPNNCRKIKLQTEDKDEDSHNVFRPKFLSINNQMKSYIIKKSPETKNKNFYEPFLKKQRLERIKKTISQQTNSSYGYSQPLGKKLKNQEIKAAKNLQFMNNRILRLDDLTDYSFQSRHLNYRKQRK